MNRPFLCVLLFLSAAYVNANAQQTPAPGKQVEQAMQDSDGDLDYLLYLPEGYDEDQSSEWPLVLFLHGRGESNGPLSLVAKWGPPKFAERGDKLPYILVSPQCPREGRWSDETRQRQLDKLIKKIQDELRVDGDRTYLTGLSMGGYGSWTLAGRHPEWFAAVVPVCGGGDPADAEQLAKLPIWVFHGDKDTAVPINKSIEMVEAIKEAGSDSIRFTTLENVGHNSWSSAYALPELYKWMMSHPKE